MAAGVARAGRACWRLRRLSLQRTSLQVLFYDLHLPYPPSSLPPIPSSAFIPLGQSAERKVGMPLSPAAETGRPSKAIAQAQAPQCFRSSLPPCKRCKTLCNQLRTLQVPRTSLCPWRETWALLGYGTQRGRLKLQGWNFTRTK